MKRKTSAEVFIAPDSKRKFPQANATLPTQSALVVILQQYGLLKAVVSSLFAEDILALALTSKALHQVITPRTCSLENLLGRLSCSGVGVAIRNMCHKKSTFSSRTTVPNMSNAGRALNVAMSKQGPALASIYEKPSDPDDPAELPNFSGFILLEPFEQPILSLHHLATDTATIPRWQNPSTGPGGPYHDQGYLDVPLELATNAPPECVEDMLDLDLGQQSLMSISEDSRYGSPSPVLSSLCRVAEARQTFLCECCYKYDAPRGPEALGPSEQPMPPLPWLSKSASATPIKQCHCTLRKRFLDRWLCLRCYQNEDSTIIRCTTTLSMKWTGLCRCGLNASHTLCLWCWGEVIEHEHDDEFSETDTTISESTT